MSEFLTPEGKKYARYIYLATVHSSRIPFLGKYIMAFVTGFTFSFILKEGAKENVRRKSKMSGLRSRASSNGKQTTSEVREMRTESPGIFRPSEIAGGVREESGEEANE